MPASSWQLHNGRMTSEVLAAAEVDAALVLCDEYFTVSMPALFNVFLSHLLRVALVIGP